MDMGKSVNVSPQQSTAKQKPCAYFLGYTVFARNTVECMIYDMIIISVLDEYGFKNWYIDQW